MITATFWASLCSFIQCVHCKVTCHLCPSKQFIVTLKIGFPVSYSLHWSIFLLLYLFFPFHGEVGAITARKRSMGQGNIFTPVCHSVHRGGAWSWGVSGPGGCLVLGVPGPRGTWSWGVCLVPGEVWSGGAWSQAGYGHGRVPGAGGVPGLGGAWSRGCLVQGVWSQEGAWWRPPPPPGRLLLQAVRILLECIIVWQ